MRYKIKFQDAELTRDMSEAEVVAFMKSVSEKRPVKIGENFYNTAYFKSMEADPSVIKLDEAQQKAFDALRITHKSDQKQIEAVNEKGLAKLRKLKSKML